MEAKKRQMESLVSEILEDLNRLEEDVLEQIHVPEKLTQGLMDLIQEVS